MTIHGTPWAALESVIRRARGRRRQLKKARHGLGRIHNPEAYAAAVEFNKQHGLKPRKRVKGLTLRTTRPITLPKLKCLEVVQEESE